MTSTTISKISFDGSVSPYAATKMINAALQASGAGKQLPPQMLYTYVKKGYIPSIEGKIFATQLNEWFAKYVAKNVK